MYPHHGKPRVPVPLAEPPPSRTVLQEASADCAQTHAWEKHSPGRRDCSRLRELTAHFTTGIGIQIGGEPGMGHRHTLPEGRNQCD